jgi:hypothetical protein
LNKAKPKNNKINAKIEQLSERVRERLYKNFNYLGETNKLNES